MQELINWLDTTIETLDNTGANDFAAGLVVARFEANKLLEKEKEQIINTYEIGSSHGMGVIEDGLDYIHGIEYFDQTYNK